MSCHMTWHMCTVDGGLLHAVQARDFVRPALKYFSFAVHIERT